MLFRSITNIKGEFDEHPDIAFLGGKILPHWKTAPPDWLNRDHWWALALLDYGEEPFYVNADNPLCLPTANASFRRELFERFGGIGGKADGEKSELVFTIEIEMKFKSKLKRSELKQRSIETNSFDFGRKQWLGPKLVSISVSVDL